MPKVYKYGLANDKETLKIRVKAESRFEEAYLRKVLIDGTDVKKEMACIDNKADGFSGERGKVINLGFCNFRSSGIALTVDDYDLNCAIGVLFIDNITYRNTEDEILKKLANVAVIVIANDRKGILRDLGKRLRQNTSDDFETEIDRFYASLENHDNAELYKKALVTLPEVRKISLDKTNMWAIKHIMAVERARKHIETGKKDNIDEGLVDKTAAICLENSVVYCKNIYESSRKFKANKETKAINNKKLKSMLTREVAEQINFIDKTFIDVTELFGIITDGKELIIEQAYNDYEKKDVKVEVATLGINSCLKFLTVTVCKGNNKYILKAYVGVKALGSIEKAFKREWDLENKDKKALAELYRSFERNDMIAQEVSDDERGIITTIQGKPVNYLNLYKLPLEIIEEDIKLEVKDNKVIAKTTVSNLLQSVEDKYEEVFLKDRRGDLGHLDSDLGKLCAACTGKGLKAAKKELITKLFGSNEICKEVTPIEHELFKSIVIKHSLKNSELAEYRIHWGRVNEYKTDFKELMKWNAWTSYKLEPIDVDKPVYVFIDGTKVLFGTMSLAELWSELSSNKELKTIAKYKDGLHKVIDKQGRIAIRRENGE